MRWVRFRCDPGVLGSPGSFPWQAWPEKTGRSVTVYDAHGEIVVVLSGGGDGVGPLLAREHAIAIGRLLEEVSWALREDESAARQCKNIATAMSERGLWATDDKHGGGRWWQRLRRMLLRY